MPETEIVIYQEADGTIPLLYWLDGLSKRARIKCLDKIERLAHFGHELRRPDCDYLSSGIYELRARAGNVHYRILYAFTGRRIALLSHGCTKEGKVPKREIAKAIENLERFKKNPQKHTYSERF